MPLIPIASQPIKMKRLSESVDVPGDLVAEGFCPDCTEENLYCLKFSTYDLLYLQMINEPILTDFSGNDCSFLTLVYELTAKEDWSAEGNWESADGLLWTGGVGGGVLTLLNPPFTPISGKNYKIEIDTTITAGSIELFWGATSLGTVSTVGISTHSDTFLTVNGTDLPNIHSSSDFDGQITGFRIYLINADWDYDNWIPDSDGCGYCIDDPEVSDPILRPSDVLQSSSGLYYYITFEVKNRTAGQVVLEGESSTLISDQSLFANDNGFYGFYFTLFGDTKIQWRGLNGFDGCIYNIRLYTQCRNHNLLFFDSNDNVIGQANYLFNYDYNWMTVSGIQPLFQVDDTLTKGECIKIGIVSNCAGSYNTLITDSYFDNDQWLLISNASIVDGELFMEGSVDPADVKYDYSALGIDCSKCFILQIHISEFTGETGALTVTVGGTSLDVDREITGTGTITYSGFTIDCPSDTIEIIFRDADIKISSVIFAYDPACQDGTEGMEFISNCMQYLGDIGQFDSCLNVIMAGMDNQLDSDLQPSSSSANPIEAFGFLCTHYFRITFREKFVFHNSHHDGQSEDYGYNNGYNKRSSALTEKLWDVSIGKVDENLHDTVALINKLDWMMFFTNFQGGIGPKQLYEGTEDNYNANWNKNNKTVVADGKFEVKKKVKSLRFSNNIV